MKKYNGSFNDKTISGGVGKRSFRKQIKDEKFKNPARRTDCARVFLVQHTVTRNQKFWLRSLGAKVSKVLNGTHLLAFSPFLSHPPACGRSHKMA